MGQFDAAQVRNMIITYGADETARRLAAEGMSQEQIESLINNSVFEGKAPADEIVKFQKKIGGKNVELRIPLGKDMEIPMNAMADTFVKEGFNKLETKDDKLYGVYYATGEKEELADVKQEKAKFLKQQEEEKMLAQQKAEQESREAWQRAAKSIKDGTKNAFKFAGETAYAMSPLGWMACADKEDTTINVGVDQNSIFQFSFGDALKSVLDSALKPIIDLLTALLEQGANNHKEEMTKLKEIVEGLKDIYTAQTETKEVMKEKIDNAVKDIIEWLKTLKDVSVSNKNEILEMLDQILKSNESLDEKLKKIIALLGDVKDLIVSAKDEIIEAIQTHDAAVIGVLTKIEENGGDNKKILEEIRDLITLYGEGGKAFANSVLEALALLYAQAQDYTPLLNEIKELIEHLKNKGDEVITGINTVLDVISKQPDYTSRLDAMLKKMDDLGDGVTKNGNTLEKILKAIKDHKVEVTVNVEGKVECHCGCGCGDKDPVHEGILKDLTDLLN